MSGGHEHPERMITELVSRIDPTDPSTLVFDIDTYCLFSPDAATVVVVYHHDLGIVVWNLEPGQRNDHHVHPSTEHVQIVIDGECEFTLGGLPPVTVRPGQAVVVPAGVAHGIANRTTRRASYLAVTSPGPYVKTTIDDPR